MDSSPQLQFQAGFFQKFWLPTCIYAILYAILLFDNFSGITLPIWVLLTLLYVYVCFTLCNRPVKAAFWIYGSGMLLLSLSVMCTGNHALQFFGNAGILCLLVGLLLHHFRRTDSWPLAKCFSAGVYTVFGPLGCISDFFSDAKASQQTYPGTKKTIATSLLIGVAIAFPILLVVSTLLYFSDAVFASILNVHVLNYLKPDKLLGFVCLLAFALLSPYCTIRFLCKPVIPDGYRDYRRLEPLIAITVLVPVTLVYAFFCGIQFFSLFLGKMQLPDGYTYAQYAREGFFQLLFVCIINLVIVLFIRGFFRENLILKILLTLLCACTYIMLASSAMRMIMYIRAYQLTILRILVLWTLLVIACLLAGILIAIYYRPFSLGRYALAVITVLFVGLSFSHPDNLIAAYNLQNYAETAQSTTDTEYLSELSTDAAPAIAQYYDRIKADTPYVPAWIAVYSQNIEDEYAADFRRFNVSHFVAERRIATLLQQ